MTTLNRFNDKLHALRSWFEESRPPSYGIAHGFVTAEPMAEPEIRRVEDQAGISLPSEYREFLLRFGDGQVGPGWFRSLRDGLTTASERPFPLTAPLLGCCSPGHQRLSKDAQREEFGRLQEEWGLIPKDDGVLLICDYGCAIFGRLILNGPFRGNVWIVQGDSAYYGPFGGSGPLHDEYESAEWEPTDSPRGYSFYEWYESWLDGQLKMAGVVGC
jgi:SMI1 / KNR4 family (SUKH-1)